MKPNSSLLAAALLAVVSLAPVAAHAGLFDDDEARRAILDARTRIEALQRDVGGRLDAKADKSSLLDLATQNEQLRLDVAKLRGQVEVLTNELANAQQRQKDFYVDLDNRLRKLEPQKVTVDGRETSIDQNEQRTYDAALELFKAGDYKGASSSFIDFLRRYPQSGYAASAQYWLGNAYYAQRDYRNAILSQQVVIKNYPDSTKAPDALLNIATCYVELKDKVSARRALDTVIAQYPDSTAARTAKDRLPSLR
ncbi:MAG: tol-pal system protein YbgF [Herminiimonas sp.]|nr:tol-pal system protein YbgF [Herminiimonas sp.]